MLCLWSGGCDSTWLLYTLLRDRRPDAVGGPEEFDKQDNTVRALTVIHPQVGARDEQKRAREGAKRALNRRKYKFQHAELVYEQYGDFSAFPAAAGGLTQPCIWLPSAYQYLHNKEALYLSYIKGDDFWHWKADAIHLFNMLNNITGKNATLHFPLEWTTKAEIVYNLQKQKLYNHTWWCEAPDTVKKPASTDGHPKRCGKCHPCLRHKTALWEIANDADYEVAKQVAIDKTCVKAIKKSRECQMPREKPTQGDPYKPRSMYTDRYKPQT